MDQGLLPTFGVNFAPVASVVKLEPTSPRIGAVSRDSSSRLSFAGLRS